MIRKTIALTVILALPLMVVGTVTDAAAGEGYFGFQGGLVIANMGGDMDDAGRELADELEAEIGGTWTADKQSRTGFTGGLTYTRMIKPTMGLQIEGMYASRGVKFDLATGGVTFDAELKFNYLEVPVLLRFAPSPEAKTQPIFLVGPVVGFESGSKMKLSAGGIDAEDDLDALNSVTFGLIGALGLRTQLNEKNALMLQARYHLGLSNAIDDDDLSSSAGDIMFMAGMEFTFGN
ncbi:MAG: PorT family protein [bacterium]|nr:PorT family protein [bacterium]